MSKIRMKQEFDGMEQAQRAIQPKPRHEVNPQPLPHEWPALTEQATALALELQLGLQRDGALHHSPLTLVPWQLPAQQFAKARAVARAIGARLAALAADPVQLQTALAPILPGTSLPARLWAQWQTIPPAERRARPLNLIRVDLLQDTAGQWKLVETNSIAAGMGPFSEGLAQIQQALWPELVRANLAPSQVPHFAPNPATETLAAALQMAALQQLNAAPVQDTSAVPTVVFVVEASEDNIFDQRKIARVLEQKGCRVVRLTLAEIDARLQRDRAPRCELRGIGPVQIFYFRTGYNLPDYHDQRGDPQRLLALRAELETLRVTLAPTIPLQLASAKAVQAHWAATVDSGIDHTALHTGQQFLQDLCAPAISDWSGWVLKSQGEGGGNVVQGDAIPLRLQQLSARERHDWLLMRRIAVTLRAQGVPMLRRGRVEFAHHLVSELGLFVLGDDLHDGGYLLRSKPGHALETGVHRGEGMIDVVALTDG